MYTKYWFKHSSTYSTSGVVEKGQSAVWHFVTTPWVLYIYSAIGELKAQWILLLIDMILKIMIIIHVTHWHVLGWKTFITSFLDLFNKRIQVEQQRTDENNELRRIAVNVFIPETTPLFSATK